MPPEGGLTAVEEGAQSEAETMMPTQPPMMMMPKPAPEPEAATEAVPQAATESEPDDTGSGLCASA